METEKTKVNLETNKTRLLNKKNSLIVKRKEFQAEIAILNAAGSFNVSIRSHQNPFLRLTRDKFKVKRSLLFDSLKRNLQKFFTRTRYYQGFY